MPFHTPNNAVDQATLNLHPPTGDARRSVAKGIPSITIQPVNPEALVASDTLQALAGQQYQISCCKPR
jgi:hypothetical protein